MRNAQKLRLPRYPRRSSGQKREAPQLIVSHQRSELPAPAETGRGIPFGTTAGIWRFPPAAELSSWNFVHSWNGIQMVGSLFKLTVRQLRQLTARPARRAAARTIPTANSSATDSPCHVLRAELCRKNAISTRAGACRHPVSSANARNSTPRGARRVLQCRAREQVLDAHRRRGAASLSVASRSASNPDRFISSQFISHFHCPLQAQAGQHFWRTAKRPISFKTVFISPSRGRRGTSRNISSLAIRKLVRDAAATNRPDRASRHLRASS